MLEAGCRLIGRSAAVQALRDEIGLIAKSDAKVLITGESGVGKEVVAHLIHRQSLREAGPLLAINCAGVPETLLESELFGHVRGSFTDAYRDHAGLLQMADRGTVFLDELGEMSLRMQGLLLRFVETGEIQQVGSTRHQKRVDVRIIAATNRDLTERIAEGAFRMDLFYRLNIVQLTVPPLRERPEDIPELLETFLEFYSGRAGRPIPRVAPDAMDSLTAYPWPGNVRELRNFVEHMLVRPRTAPITQADLPAKLRPAVASSASSAGSALVAPAAPAAPSRADAIFQEMVSQGESFWTAAYPKFIARDLTRDDLRHIVGRGLQFTRGNYRDVVRLFGMPNEDYKRFLNFLRKHACHLPFQSFRGGVLWARSPESSTASALPRERTLAG